MEQPRTRREHEVWQACDDLWTQNAVFSKVTGDAIRDQLFELGYKKGSPNEIYKYRTSWKKSRAIDDAFEPEANNSGQNNDPISRAVALVHEQLKSEANTSLESAKEEFDLKYAKVSSQLEELQLSHLKLQAERIELQAQLALVKTENDENRSNLIIASTKNQNLVEQMAHNNLFFQQLECAFEKLTTELTISETNKREVLEQKLEQVRQFHQDELETLRAKLKEQGGLAMDEANALKVEIYNHKNEQKLLQQSLSTVNQENSVLKNERDKTLMPLKSIADGLSRLFDLQENQNVGQNKWQSSVSDYFEALQSQIKNNGERLDGIIANNINANSVVKNDLLDKLGQEIKQLNSNFLSQPKLKRTRS